MAQVQGGGGETLTLQCPPCASLLSRALLAAVSRTTLSPNSIFLHLGPEGKGNVQKTMPRVEETWPQLCRATASRGTRLKGVRGVICTLGQRSVWWV